MDEQLDVFGGSRQLTRGHERMRLFEAPRTARGQLAMGTDALMAPAERDIAPGRVVPSDCRTGWLVVDGAGRALSPVFRRREAAENWRP